MKKLIVLGVLCSIPAIVFFGCKHEPVLPAQEVSFSQDIMPIIQMGCQHEGCHGDSLNPEFPLTSYEEVMEEGDIKPGDPEDSDLYERITETDDDKRMPRPPYAPLNDRNIKLIYIWIAQGAKNN